MPQPVVYGEDFRARALNPDLNVWCEKHKLSFWDMDKVQNYEIPVAWYFLSAARDPRTFDLMLKGLRSPNVVIASSAAHGLAVLQDPRAVDEMISIGRRTGNEARFEIAKSLLFFSDPKAQAAAEDLIPEKEQKILDATRSEVKAKGINALLPW
jgi:hypothetical protein